MREMKDSGVEWIGKCPHNWNVFRCKYALTIQTGYPFSSDLFSDSGFPIIRIRDITFGKTETYYSGSFEEKFIVRSGDLLIGMDGDFYERWWNSNDALLNQRCCRVFEKEQIARRFLYYILPFGLKVVNDLTNSTTVKHLSNDGIKNIFASFPQSKKQQNEITEYLDSRILKIDSIVANVQTQIEKLKAYKQSLITETVTKGLDKNVPMKDSGVEWIGKVPEEVQISRVGLHFNITLGKMVSSEKKTPIETQIPYFCAANVHFDGISNVDNLKQMWFSPEEIKKYEIRLGDLLVVEGGAGAGGCAVITDIKSRCCIQNSIIRVCSRLNQSNSVAMLYYQIQCLVKNGYIDFICNRATIPHFTKDKLSAMPIVLWEKEIQQKIVSYLDTNCRKIDELVKLKENKIDRLNQYKKSLIYEYVTGKKEVR